jgi:hypothetical protein
MTSETGQTAVINYRNHLSTAAINYYFTLLDVYAGI